MPGIYAWQRKDGSVCRKYTPGAPKVNICYREYSLALPKINASYRYISLG
jgi:hypothetical protein